MSPTAKISCRPPDPNRSGTRYCKSHSQEPWYGSDPVRRPSEDGRGSPEKIVSCRGEAFIHNPLGSLLGQVGRLVPVIETPPCSLMVTGAQAHQITPLVGHPVFLESVNRGFQVGPGNGNRSFPVQEIQADGVTDQPVQRQGIDGLPSGKKVKGDVHVRPTCRYISTTVP